MNVESKDYERLIAAQNEATRRLKIRSINNKLSEEKAKKSKFAIISGVCMSGVIAATLFSGIDPEQAWQTQIQALNSFEALKEYFSMLTPAIYGTMIATTASLCGYIKHHKKQKKASQELDDILSIKPEFYLDDIKKEVEFRKILEEFRENKRKESTESKVDESLVTTELENDNMENEEHCKRNGR